jgi:hypothetical protein
MKCDNPGFKGIEVKPVCAVRFVLLEHNRNK